MFYEIASNMLEKDGGTEIGVEGRFYHGVRQRDCTSTTTNPRKSTADGLYGCSLCSESPACSEESHLMTTHGREAWWETERDEMEP